MSFYKIRPRSGTKAQWETANTILAEREIGYELPDGGVGTGVVKMKMGDGVTAWNDLPYAIPIYLSPDDIVQDATTDSSVKVPSASVTKNLQDQVTALNNSLPKKYYGEPNGAYVEDVKDCSFILYPNIKRVDFQFAGNIKATIHDWTQLVKIPTDLQISKSDDAYCGTSITYDGKIGICYISPLSHEGYLCPFGISDAAVGQFVKLFGSYYIN